MEPTKGGAHLAKRQVYLEGTKRGTPGVFTPQWRVQHWINVIEAQIEIEQKRLVAWDRLNPTEQSLVEEGFPVLYGIHPTRQRSCETLKDASEILINDGAKVEEIRVVYVPAAKIELVRKMLADKLGEHAISVWDIEDVVSESER